MNGKCGPSSAAIAAAYFGRLTPSSYWNPFELSNVMSVHTQRMGYLRIGHLPPPLTMSMNDCVLMNSADNLATSLRSMGLFAVSGISTLDQMATAISKAQVVLVHWVMGSDRSEAHWSVVQGFDPGFIHLRDPWPASPNDNLKLLSEFYHRALVGPGLFTTVRVSDRPIH